MAKVKYTTRNVVTNDLGVTASAIRTCTNCDLHLNRIQGVPGVGPINARFMIIGEAPGFNENQDGEPFIGAAGATLNGMLKEVGINRGECFVTNMVKCWPGPGNPDPTEEQIEACDPWLMRQIMLIKPEGIITFGRFSTGKWIEHRTLGRVQGFIRRVSFDKFTTYVVPIYHPAYIRRNSGERAESLRHLTEFARLFD